MTQSLTKEDIEKAITAISEARSTIHHIDGNRMNNDINNLMPINDPSTYLPYPSDPYLQSRVFSLEQDWQQWKSLVLQLNGSISALKSTITILQRENTDIREQLKATLEKLDDYLLATIEERYP